MSAMKFLMSGGMATIGGDLSKEEQTLANDIIKSFGEKVRKYALGLQVPAAQLKIQQCSFLLVAKDTAHFHFVFADTSGGANLNYRDFTSEGRLELKSLIHQVRIEIGEVAWAFSCPVNVPLTNLEDHIQSLVVQYVNVTLQSQRNVKKEISSEAKSVPEIALGLEKFRVDYPIGKKTAFIIMQFRSTKPHNHILSCVKSTLAKFNIIGLRADDKEYMDDLFPNIKTYMHGCDFGIAIFDRITEDDFNPNVSLEVGYMLGMEKNVLLLKDQTLKSLQTDLAGKLYKSFDTNDINKTLPSQIEKWLADKGLI